MEAGSFRGCSLEYIYIPKSVTKIDSYAFDGVNQIGMQVEFKLFYAGTEEEWKEKRFSFWGDPTIFYSCVAPTVPTATPSSESSYNQ